MTSSTATGVEERAIYRMTLKARRWARQANKAATSGERADLNEDAEDLRLVLKLASAALSPDAAEQTGGAE